MPRATPLLCAALALAAQRASGQWGEGTAGYNAALAKGDAALDYRLETHPEFVHKDHPELFEYDKNQYFWNPPKDFTVNVIFDPCRNRAFDCCTQVFGSPEYISSIPISDVSALGNYVTVDDHGNEIPEFERRLPTTQIIYDYTCLGLGNPVPECLAAGVMKAPFAIMPNCWNYNDTMDAASTCRTPRGGAVIKFCMELGFTTTAFIMECANKWNGNSHCGTFLEVHRVDPDPATYLDVVGEVALREQFVSGYTRTVLTTTYKRSNKIICLGSYEIWWVVRTRWRFDVLKKMPFGIASPRCDWDPVNNAFLKYATPGKTQTLTNVDPYADSKFLYSSPADVQGYQYLGP